MNERKDNFIVHLVGVTKTERMGKAVQSKHRADLEIQFKIPDTIRSIGSVVVAITLLTKRKQPKTMGKGNWIIVYFHLCRCHEKDQEYVEPYIF